MLQKIVLVQVLLLFRTLPSSAQAGEPACPLRVALLYSPIGANSYTSSSLASGSLSSALSHHIHVEHNPGSLDGFHAAILLARNLRTYQELASFRGNHTGLLVGIAKAASAEEWYLPLIDFAVADNKFLEELFLGNGIATVRLPPLDLPRVESRSPPHLAPFTQIRPATLCFHGTPHEFTELKDVIPGLNRISKAVPMKLRLIHELDSKHLYWDLLGSLAFPYEAFVLDHSTLSSRLMGCDLALVPQSDKNFHELPPENPFMRNYSCFDMKKAQHWYADGIITYKRSANAAKVLVYAMQGIPVVADAAPSIIEAVEKPGLGYVAEHRSAWEVYIGSFLTVSEERKRLSDRAVDYTSQQLGDVVRGAILVDFFLKDFSKRLPDHVVTRCAAARGTADRWVKHSP